MPLSPPAPREHIHTRTIECRGFRREDGLWDIEAHMVDAKTYGFENTHRGTVAPGEPVHGMWMRLTVDNDFVIRAVEAVTDYGPFRICPDATANYQRLVGLSITAGFNTRAKELLGGTQGCTHLLELLKPMGTTAFQTIMPLRDRSGERQPGRRPRLLDSCHAFASDGEVVQQLWPDFYTGPR